MDPATTKAVQALKKEMGVTTHDGIINNTAIDFSFLTLAATMVFFMQAGFSSLCAGFVRKKNRLVMHLKLIMDMCLGAVVWFLIGKNIAFGRGRGYAYHDFVDSPELETITDKMEKELGIPNVAQAAFMFFQYTISTTPATIISGAIAERVDLRGYFILSTFMTGLIYPVIAGQIWGGGHLAQVGFADFAGSAVIHACGGIPSLLAVYLIGPRLGRYEENGDVNEIDFEHASVQDMVQGLLFLWFGWFGFNAGSAFNYGGPAYSYLLLAGHVCVTTALSGAAGGLASMVYFLVVEERYTLAGLCNGILGGLVGITSSCNGVTAESAIIIGMISGLIVPTVEHFVLWNLKQDDAVGAFAVHGCCGSFGVLAVGLFDVHAGLFYSGDPTQLFIQFYGLVVIACITLPCVGLLIFILMKAGLWRVPAHVEIAGCDSEIQDKVFVYMGGNPDKRSTAIGDASVHAHVATQIVVSDERYKKSAADMQRRSQSHQDVAASDDSIISHLISRTTDTDIMRKKNRGDFVLHPILRVTGSKNTSYEPSLMSRRADDSGDVVARSNSLQDRATLTTSQPNTLNNPTGNGRNPLAEAFLPKP